MTDEMKDAEQDKRLSEIEKDIDEIKTVTHGSEILGWKGIVLEHQGLTITVESLKENSDFNKKLMSKTMLFVTRLGSIVGLLITLASFYYLIFK